MDEEKFRVQIWNHLSDVKFQANYCHLMSSISGRLSYFYSFILSFGSSGSVAAWAIWQQYPKFWAGLVVLMQILHIGRAHIPFLKHESAYKEMAYEFERLYLKCEKFWFDWEQKKVPLEKAASSFYKLREKQNEIAQRGVECAKITSLVKRAEKTTCEDLDRNLGKGE